MGTPAEQVESCYLTCGNGWGSWFLPQFEGIGVFVDGGEKSFARSLGDRDAKSGVRSWIDRELADKLARGGEFHDFTWLARVRIDWKCVVIRGDQISVGRQQQSRRTMQVNV